MYTIINIIILYVYDSLRGDGMAVRFARLNMLTAQFSVVLALCWLMEAMFYMAYYGRSGVRMFGIVNFWLAWFVILATV